jgi:hypothetical protein
VHILGELAVPGTISAALMAVVRLVRIILAYRLRCKEIQLLREQLELVPASQPAKAASARHACQRRRLR